MRGEMVRRYRAADAAACLIEMAIGLKNPVSNLQLQKILFFCQCTCLQDKGEVLFSDDFVAWQYGPVVQSVYNTYSYRGASPILRAARFVNNYFDGDTYQIRELDGDTKRLVEQVLARWINKPAWDLVRKTHAPGGAWDQIYNAGGNEGSGYGQTIPIDLMRLEDLA